MLANNRSALCIVMTYCDGGDLEGYLKKNRGVMKESKAMHFFIQITLGLDYLHSKKVREKMPSRQLVTVAVAPVS